MLADMEKTSKKTAAIGIRIPPELRKELDKIRVKEDRSLSSQVVHFLRQSITQYKAKN